MNNKSFLGLSSINKYKSNLTELNATTAVNNGFIDHADWLAHVARYAVIMKYLKKSGVKHQKIIDVGCGRFPLLVFMWRNRVPLANVEYTGIDLRAKEEWLNDKLPEAPSIQLVRADIIEDDISFIEPADIVVCTEVLEHIDKVYALSLMVTLRTLTKPGGYMFMSSPNLGGSDSVADNHTADDGTPREWTYDGKVKLLEMSGFTIESEIGTFIRMDNLPDEFFNDYTRDIKNKLPNSFFRVFAAAAFPRESNNAVFVCRPK